MHALSSSTTFIFAFNLNTHCLLFHIMAVQSAFLLKALKHHS